MMIAVPIPMYTAEIVAGSIHARPMKEPETMFKKILIANRGEIAVRIIRTCREMGIRTVAIYEASDQNSLHVRLADECVQLASHNSFMEPETILSVAVQSGVDAVHPGYGFLAEDALRRLRKPDPYQQKGVRYTGEVLKKKAGKTGA